MSNLDDLEKDLKTRKTDPPRVDSGFFRSIAPQKKDITSIVAVIASVIALFKPQQTDFDAKVNAATQQCEAAVATATTRLELESKITAGWHSRIRQEFDEKIEEQRRILYLTRQAAGEKTGTVIVDKNEKEEK